ncbi:MAG: thioredoxin domain-containing protein [Spirochaetia bacterium]
MNRLTLRLGLAVVGPAIVLMPGCSTSSGGEGGASLQTAAEDDPGIAVEIVPATNRLASEKSPYLLQHADNPINWFAWSDEAFEAAAREDKPIFMSIGYSACHWCHVMEEESFTDPAVAALLNESFIAILVDREERPDIDSIYMTAANVMSGRGGWPLNVIMTPDKRPFFTSTYIPRESRPGQVGMLDLLPFFADAWQTRRADIDATAAQVVDVLARLQAVPPSAGFPGADAIAAGVANLAGTFDREYGGFGERPKFPQAHVLLFLLRYSARTGDAEARRMAERTLTAIRHGGVFDQIGFGVHRYAVDRPWLTPHFEKMLYDQALMTLAYTEAYEATGGLLYEQSAREILTYVERDMTSPVGAFYASEDADSEGEEGTFYLWALDDILSVLGDDGPLAVGLLGVSREGNHVDEVTGSSSGSNILHLPLGFRKFAADHSMPADELAGEWEIARRRLLEAREQRERPLLDDKILTDWNGLMIAAYARAGRVFDEPGYVAAAADAFSFVMTTLRRPDGRLLHRYRDGDAGIEGHLDDYAFLLWGAVELYGATYDPEFLGSALSIAETMVADFWDDANGGLFFTSAQTDTALVRQKVSIDTDLPSGNSVAMLQLARLARLTGRVEFEDRAWDIGRAFGAFIEQVPEGYTHMLTAVEYLAFPSYEVVVVGPRGSAVTEEMLERLRLTYLPGMVVLHKEPKDSRLSDIAEFTRYHTLLNDQPTVYVCQNFACQLPTNDVEVMISLLGEE